MLHSYLTNNNTSSNNFYKKKNSFSNSHSITKIINRNRTVSNSKIRFSRKNNSNFEKTNFIKQRINSGNILNNFEINKQIENKKQSSSFYNSNANYSSYNHSFLNENNNDNSIFKIQEKNKILNHSQINNNLNLKGNNILNNSNEKNKMKRKKILLENDYQNQSFNMNTFTENNLKNYNKKVNNIEIENNNIKKIFKHTLVNSGSMFNINTNNIKEQPLKLYKGNSISNHINLNIKTEQNNQSKFSNSLINNKSSLNINNNNINNTFNNLLVSNKNTFNISINEQLSKEINEIELNLEKNLLENITNSKSKKYNTIKHAFEDLLKLLQCNNKQNNSLNSLLQKIIIGYHEVVTTFSVENRELKQMNILLNEKNEKMEKTVLETMDKMNEKKKEVDFLKKKISTLSLDTTESNTNYIVNSNDLENTNNKFKNNTINNNIKISINNINNNNIINNNSKLNKNNTLIPNLISFDKGIYNEKIYQINKNNLDDLEALYFFDKIKIKNQRSSSSHNIPYLNLKKNETNFGIKLNKSLNI